MTSVAICSVAGAPGVSTLVAAMATTATTDAPLLVVEAAPSGGVVAARWGWPRQSTVAALAMDPDGRVDLWRQARGWIDGARIVPADPSAVVMAQAQPGHWLATALPSVGVPVVVDAGRVDGSADQLDLLSAVDRRWLLVAPTVEQVVAARASAGWLRRAGPVGLLVAEPAPGTVGGYAAGEVAATVGWPTVATIPHDRPAAAALSGQAPARRDLRRSPLVRAGRQLAHQLQPAGVAS